MEFYFFWKRKPQTQHTVFIIYLYDVLLYTQYIGLFQYECHHHHHHISISKPYVRKRSFVYNEIPYYSDQRACAQAIYRTELYHHDDHDISIPIFTIRSQSKSPNLRLCFFSSLNILLCSGAVYMRNKNIVCFFLCMCFTLLFLGICFLFYVYHFIWAYHYSCFFFPTPFSLDMCFVILLLTSCASMLL